MVHCYFNLEWLRNCRITTISDKVVETVNSSRITSKNKTIQTPPPSPPFEVGCLLFFLQIARTRPQHCMEGVGEGKFYFLFFKSAKSHKGPLRKSVSANSVADCRKVYFCSLNKRFE